MVKLALALALFAGCGGASLGDDDGTGGHTDANGGSGSAQADAAPDSPPACASGRKVFLEFLGVTLTTDTTSDATTNKARWLTNASAVVPQWRSGGANRATEIEEVIAGVKARLFMTPIDVVTVRPTSGPYVMIVFGGENTGGGGTVGTIYSYATSFHDCGDTVKSDVGWVSDMTGETTEFVADLAVGAIGWGLGLDGTTDTGDCMCGWANGCSSAAGACTLTSNIASSITSGNETACVQGSQNEIASFTTEFCQ